MVNRSKINDPRFWKKWERSGAIGTMDKWYENRFPEWRQFKVMLGNIEAGYFGDDMIERASLFADEHKLPKDRLDGAVRKGSAKTSVFSH